MPNILTLKPGLLVSLRTTLTGGVKYSREDLREETDGEGAKVEEWKTTKTVDDQAEYDAAIKARSKCGSLVRSVCSHSSFGLLCPADKEEDLDAAIAEARAHADRFNADAKVSQVGVYVLKGRIAENEREAARAIAEEMRGLLDGMKEGVDQGDVEKIRDAANRAKKIGLMLDAENSKKVSAAILAARDAAKQIVKRVKVGGEALAKVAQEFKLQELDAARFAFLDMEGPVEVKGEPMAPADDRALEIEDGEADPAVEAAAKLSSDALVEAGREAVALAAEVSRVETSEPVTAMIWPESPKLDL